MLPGPILITSCLRRKDTRLSAWYIFAFQESLGTRLIGRHNVPSLTSADKGKMHVTKSMGSDASLLCGIIFFPVVVPSPPKHQCMDRLNVQQKRLQAPSPFDRDWSHYTSNLNCISTVIVQHTTLALIMTHDSCWWVQLCGYWQHWHHVHNSAYHQNVRWICKWTTCRLHEVLETISEYILQPRSFNLWLDTYLHSRRAWERG